MGFRQVMHRLFSDPADQSEALVRLTSIVSRMGRELEAVQEELRAHKARYGAFEGRVYAWKGRDLPASPLEKPGELPLSDPRVPIAEVRARLLKPGKPVNHT